MEVVDPKKSRAPDPPGSLPAPPLAVTSSGDGAEPQEMDASSAPLDILQKAPEACAASPALKPDNIVAEIVDQITEKQSRSARQAHPPTAAGEVCSFCLEEGALAGAPYRVVLKCVTDDSEP
jgi:hypothetical protein